MKIENLKQLQQVIQLCRKLGVDAIEIGDIKMNIGQAPAPTAKRATPRQSVNLNNLPITYAPNEITADTKILTDELTPEQLLFYSAQDHLPNEQQ